MHGNRSAFTESSASPPAGAPGRSAPPPSDSGAGGPSSFAQVLWDELGHLGRHDGAERAPRLREIYGRIGAFAPGKALSALCLSGGGIRSATFNLGVIQALAGAGLLGRFDYLSSVSGGGYIAGWLRAWLNVEPTEEVVAALARPARALGFDPLEPEPKPIDYLREYSNYLTPRVGLFSADTWAALALAVRNLILNWLVLVPALAAFVAAPQVALIVVQASGCASGRTLPATWIRWAVLLAVVLALWSSAAVHHFRRRRTAPATQSTILTYGAAPLWLASVSLSTAGVWVCEASVPDGSLWVFCLSWCILIPLAGWALGVASAGRQQVALPWTSEVVGIVLSGAATAALLYAIVRSVLPSLQGNPSLFVILGVPILLVLYLLARALFVAFASVGETGRRPPDRASEPGELAHADREWWARFSGWVLILATAWLGISALVLLGGLVLGLYAGPLLGRVVALAGGLSSLATGLITALLGRSPGTASGHGARSTPSSAAKEVVLRILASVTLALIVLLLSMLTGWAGRKFTGLDELLRVSTVVHPLRLPRNTDLFTIVLSFLAVPFLFALVSWLFGWVVNVNRFSAHGLYRNRLVRAYLGASNPRRHPDPFTGFDPKDNIALHGLLDGASPRPIPVVNATLNLVKSARKLAWQQRKAESFSMTPLYCGNFHEGYRASREYGGPRGISLGTAMTISGAAANPNAGYHSSPLVAFLMTLFNVRLGCWLGNTNARGQQVYRRSGPRHAWMSLFADLFGFTDAEHAYVSLSDGGHFENLGVYEMVLRRCRFIVASDAGHDPDHDLEDLGNLIRKVRIDFGIPIRFDQPICILPRKSQSGHGLLCALGTIAYDEIDPGAQPGQLLYIKPTLRAAGRSIPYDVFSYARASEEFPHEPTADQWFSEAQFESYRTLARHLAEQLGDGRTFQDLQAYFKAVGDQLGQAAQGSVPLTV